ncbi:MAG: LysM peptidoglycan-binding domain-containing protein [Anaerolineales bacterium]|nr:LysM peptidoglycan-binding domain-containing protein [Anaerolineales bacterium]
MSGQSGSINIPVGAAVAAPVIALILGALIMVALVKGGLIAGPVAIATAPPVTPTITLTLQPSGTPAPTLTFTPLPPIVITVQAGDTCSLYMSEYGITDPNQIKQEGGKSVNCDLLVIGATLYIPQPTPTPPPASTETANAVTQTYAACEFIPYEVKDGDTLAGIADMYDVSIESIKRWNPQYSFANDVVFVGMKLKIPVCEREPTAGPSPTPTTPPPYPAPNLLTPRDGTIFGMSDNEIALQWAEVAALRESEEYQVSIRDISLAESEKSMFYVKETRLIVPADFKPTDGTVHIFEWRVTVVRKTGTTDAGNPVYASAGAVSERRVFGWGGTGLTASTPAG